MSLYERGFLTLTYNTGISALDPSLAEANVLRCSRASGIGTLIGSTLLPDISEPDRLDRGVVPPEQLPKPLDSYLHHRDQVCFLIYLPRSRQFPSPVAVAGLFDS